MLVHDLDDVTFDAEADGDEVRRTVARRAWERRGWATVVALYEERGRDGSWRAKLAVLRFRRSGEAWKKHAQVTLPADQARELAALLAASSDRLATASDDDDA